MLKSVKFSKPCLRWRRVSSAAVPGPALGGVSHLTMTPKLKLTSSPLSRGARPRSLPRTRAGGQSDPSDFVSRFRGGMCTGPSSSLGPSDKLKEHLNIAWTWCELGGSPLSPHARREPPRAR